MKQEQLLELKNLYLSLHEAKRLFQKTQDIKEFEIARMKYDDGFHTSLPSMIELLSIMAKARSRMDEQIDRIISQSKLILPSNAHLEKILFPKIKERRHLATNEPEGYSILELWQLFLEDCSINEDDFFSSPQKEQTIFLKEFISFALDEVQLKFKKPPEEKQITYRAGTYNKDHVEKKVILPEEILEILNSPKPKKYSTKKKKNKGKAKRSKKAHIKTSKVNNSSSDYEYDPNQKCLFLSRRDVEQGKYRCTELSVMVKAFSSKRKAKKYINNHGCYIGEEYVGPNDRLLIKHFSEGKSSFSIKLVVYDILIFD